MTDIFVFKTNIKSLKDVRVVEPVLNSYAGISYWNVDRSDIDNVLKVESTYLKSDEIIKHINAAGFCCEELPD